MPPTRRLTSFTTLRKADGYRQPHPDTDEARRSPSGSVDLPMPLRPTQATAPLLPFSVSAQYPLPKTHQGSPVRGCRAATESQITLDYAAASSHPPSLSLCRITNLPCASAPSRASRAVGMAIKLRRNPRFVPQYGLRLADM